MTTGRRGLLPSQVRPVRTHALAAGLPRAQTLLEVLGVEDLPPGADGRSAGLELRLEGALRRRRRELHRAVGVVDLLAVVGGDPLAGDLVGAEPVDRPTDQIVTRGIQRLRVIGELGQRHLVAGHRAVVDVRGLRQPDALHFDAVEGLAVDEHRVVVVRDAGVRVDPAVVGSAAHVRFGGHLAGGVQPLRIPHVAQDDFLDGPAEVLAEDPPLSGGERLIVVRAADPVFAVEEVDRLAPDVGVGLVQRARLAEVHEVVAELRVRVTPLVRDDVVEVEQRAVVGRLAVPVGVRADLVDQVHAPHRRALPVVRVVAERRREEVVDLTGEPVEVLDHRQARKAALTLECEPVGVIAVVLRRVDDTVLRRVDQRDALHDRARCRVDDDLLAEGRSGNLNRVRQDARAGPPLDQAHPIHLERRRLARELDVGVLARHDAAGDAGRRRRRQRGLRRHREDRNEEPVHAGDAIAVHVHDELAAEHGDAAVVLPEPDVRHTDRVAIDLVDRQDSRRHPEICVAEADDGAVLG